MFNNGGGSGAANAADGWPLIGTTSASGGLKSLSVEQIELIYPILVEHWQLEPESMGYGHAIGGPGNRFVVRPRADPLSVVEYGDGRSNPPHGVLGGTPGFGGGAYVENRTTGKRRFVSATGEILVEMDEVWVGVSSGGGGYGDPLQRDPHTVAENVRDGLISPETAKTVFGVSLTTSLEPQIHQDETEALRAQIHDQRDEPPTITPTKPNAATWLQEHMTENDEYLLNPQIG